GDADDKAFAAAKESNHFFANTVASAKTLQPSDKAYVAYVASMEKEAAGDDAKIEQRRVGSKVDKHRALVESKASIVVEKMKALEGEAQDPAFEAAEAAVSELKSALESADEEAAKDKTHHGEIEA